MDKKEESKPIETQEPKGQKEQKKNSKKKIFGIICAIIAIATAAFVVINHNIRNKEYDEQLEIYTRYAHAAEQVNSIIDEKVELVDAAIQKDIGKDTAKIKKIEQKKETLLEFKIEIPEKIPDDIDEIKQKNENLENKLKDIDENLPNLPKDEKWIPDAKLPIAKVIKDIDDLDKDITDLEEKEKQRKEEEEAKKKAEEAEKKAKEEREKKILNGDLSYCAGNYHEGENSKLLISNNEFTLAYIGTSPSDIYTESFPAKKAKRITKESNGSYKYIIVDGSSDFVRTFFEVKPNCSQISFCQSGGCNVFTK